MSNVDVLIEYNVEEYIDHWKRVFFSQDLEKAKEHYLAVVEELKTDLRLKGVRLNRMICTQTNIEEVIV